jgi:uncharacterized delta-60 repeat protein
LGLRYSPGITLGYYYDSVNNTYCVDATHDSGVSYYVTSDNTVAQEGQCIVPAASIAFAWGGAGYEQGNDIIQTSDGGYAVTGYTTSYGAGSYDLFIAKYDAGFGLTWVKTWGGTGWDTGEAIVQTSDGGYAITGKTDSFGAGGQDVLVVKYDADGNLEWNKTWGGSITDYGSSIVQTSDGGYAVTGRKSASGAGYDVFLNKYTSTGTLSWSRAWGVMGGNDYGETVIQTSDGGYAVSGTTYSYGAGSNCAFIAKYTSAGTLSWSRTWGGSSSEYGYAMAQTADDGYVITGSTSSFGVSNNDMYIAKFDSSGTLSWDSAWGGSGSGFNYGYAVTQTSDGGYAVSGFEYGFGIGGFGTSGNNIMLVKYNSSGTLEWDRVWSGDNTDDSYSVVQTSDGGYAIAGFTKSYGEGGDDLLITKYDMSGDMPGCVSPMYIDPTATITNPSATVNSPTASVATLNLTVTTPSATVTSPSTTTTPIVSAP